jgi:hypothetical protein
MTPLGARDRGPPDSTRTLLGGIFLFFFFPSFIPAGRGGEIGQALAVDRMRCNGSCDGCGITLAIKEM